MKLAREFNKALRALSFCFVGVRGRSETDMLVLTVKDRQLFIELQMHLLYDIGPEMMTKDVSKAQLHHNEFEFAGWRIRWVP